MLCEPIGYLNAEKSKAHTRIEASIVYSQKKSAMSISQSSEECLSFFTSMLENAHET
jgi:hypothetical protein